VGGSWSRSLNDLLKDILRDILRDLLRDILKDILAPFNRAISEHLGKNR
jgi:hypothetical protein